MRHWRFGYAAAAELVDHTDPVDVGDELGLRWRGELRAPELARRGEGRRAIVTAVHRDAGDIAQHVAVSLISEGNDASTRG